MEDIIYNNEKIEYIIIRQRIKNVYIQIKEQEVVVKVPIRARRDEIRKLVKQKAKWIYENLEKQKNKKQKEGLYTQEEFIKIIEEELNALKEQTGLIPKKISIKQMKSAWGTCTIKKNISINQELIKYNKDVIRYVILHELCHLKYMNHQKEFWELLYKYMPNYKQIRQELKR
ncbi:MAG: M48 family metallopeptidase [Clostridia bacterium]|jgi:predicted metal-dependent hydrolase|nr:M48 family metallopeptidase [Clostridia bacterium]